MKQKDTDIIENELHTVQHYGEFHKKHSNDLNVVHPGVYILDIASKKKIDKKEIIRTVNLNTGYVYEIFRQEKRPNRDKLFHFIFALRLDTKETQTMLKRCGYAALYGKNPRDSVIMFCLNRKKSLIDTNILLHQYELNTL